MEVGMQDSEMELVASPEIVEVLEQHRDVMLESC